MEGVYVRHKGGEPRRGRTFDGPHGEIATTPCDHCGREIGSSKIVLIAVGPSDLDSLRKAQAGHWYNALADVVHEDCATDALKEIT